MSVVYTRRCCRYFLRTKLYNRKRNKTKERATSEETNKANDRTYATSMSTQKKKKKNGKPELRSSICSCESSKTPIFTFDFIFLVFLLMILSMARIAYTYAMTLMRARVPTVVWRQFFCIFSFYGTLYTFIVKSDILAELRSVVALCVEAAALSISFLCDLMSV